MLHSAKSMAESLSSFKRSLTERPGRPRQQRFLSMCERRDTWPVGYAWPDASVLMFGPGSEPAALFRFIFSKTNPVRKLCHWILHAQAWGSPSCEVCQVQCSAGRGRRLQDPVG